MIVDWGRVLLVAAYRLGWDVVAYSLWKPTVVNHERVDDTCAVTPRRHGTRALGCITKAAQV